MNWVTAIITLIKYIPDVLNIIERIRDINAKREEKKRKGEISRANKMLASKSLRDRMEGIDKLEKNISK